MTDELEIRVAWTRAVGAGRAADDVLDALLARHREPHRRYHGLRHVVWVLRHVHELAAETPVTDHGAVVVAGCFHDAVYDPRRTDNEDVSARLAVARLVELGWSDERCESVAAMVRATADHTSTPVDGADVVILLDADLAVLAADASAYQAYVTGVRAEYAHVDDASWRLGRSEVLAGFLRRPAIYATPAGRRRWEARARANVTAELATLATLG